MKYICVECGKDLKEKDIVWLELNMDTGQYSKERLPENISQGMFEFGKTCAKKVLANNGYPIRNQRSKNEEWK